MAKLTVYFGLALIVLGIGGYLGTGAKSPTALIPAAFGLLLTHFGQQAKDPAKRKRAMHLAAMVGLVAVLGSASRLPAALRLMAGEEVARPAAAISSAIMFVISLVFVALCVKSFVDARRSGALG